MIKLELNEVAIMLGIIEQSSFKGIDCLKMAELIKKLQKEMIKLNPDGNDG